MTEIRKLRSILQLSSLDALQPAVTLQGSGSTSGWQQGCLLPGSMCCLQGSDGNPRAAGSATQEEAERPCPRAYPQHCLLPTPRPWLHSYFPKPVRRQQRVWVRFHPCLGSPAMRTLAQVSPMIEAHCCQLSHGVSHAEQRGLQAGSSGRLLGPRGFRKMSQVGQVRLD